MFVLLKKSSDYLLDVILLIVIAGQMWHSSR